MIDPVTGYALKRKKEDEPAPFLPGMVFWRELDRSLIGARSENGFLIPSEVDAKLDRLGIKDQDNRDTAILMLEMCAIGRNQAANEKIGKG